jgi:hypothetical protein
MPLPLLAIPAIKYGIPLAISGISALAGIFSNRAKKQEQESTTTSNTSSSTLPQFDSKQLIMRDLLMDRLLGRTEDNDDVFGGYQTNGLNTINAGADASQRAIENILAARGLGRTSAGATSFLGNQINRVNQGSSLINSIPLLADERRRASLNDAAAFWKGLPVGQTTTGTQVSTTKGVATQPGNMLGGGLTGLGTALAGLYGEGAFGGEPANRPRYTGFPTYSQQAPKVNTYGAENWQALPPMLFP